MLIHSRFEQEVELNVVHLGYFGVKHHFTFIHFVVSGVLLDSSEQRCVVKQL